MPSFVLLNQNTTFTSMISVTYFPDAANWRVGNLQIAIDINHNLCGSK